MFNKNKLMLEIHIISISSKNRSNEIHQSLIDFDEIIFLIIKSFINMHFKNRPQSNGEMLAHSLIILLEYPF